MEKKIDLSKSVYELVGQYPELVGIMAGLGFTEITKKVMLNSVGKLMTIPKGAMIKKIPMQDVVLALMEHGFQIVGGRPGTEGAPEVAADGARVHGHAAPGHRPGKEGAERMTLLKGYLSRLSAGESLEQVRADFAEHFSDVEAVEIMRAEQELMAGGAPLEEVQRLCDVHSALFHGRTREERIAHAEQEVGASMERERQRQAMEEHRQQERRIVATAQASTSDTIRLKQTDGHPLQTLYRENEALDLLLEEAHRRIEAGDDLGDLVDQVRGIAIHYAKKGDLLYPHLKVKYDLSGPSQVMWTVDDEIRDELSRLSRQADHDGDWLQRAAAVLQRAEEMIYKENNILFPLCAGHFTDEEWQRIYRDAKDYPACLGVEPLTWEAGEQQVAPVARPQGEIVMPGGHLTLEQLTAMLNTLPIEITFVDADNINRYFNEGPKVFKRPGMAIDREVFSCHPPKIEPMVRAIIDDFRQGRRSQLPIWMEKNGRTMLVNYMAVRDGEGRYVGTVEVVQDMEFAREHFLGRRSS